MYLSLSLRAWDCVASARRGLPLGRKIYLLTYLLTPQRRQVEVLSHECRARGRVAQAATHGQAAKQQKITSGLTFRVGSSELKGSAAS